MLSFAATRRCCLGYPNTSSVRITLIDCHLDASQVKRRKKRRSFPLRPIETARSNRWWWWWRLLLFSAWYAVPSVFPYGCSSILHRLIRRLDSTIYTEAKERKREREKCGSASSFALFDCLRSFDPINGAKWMGPGARPIRLFWLETSLPVPLLCLISLHFIFLFSLKLKPQFGEWKSRKKSMLWSSLKNCLHHA